MLCNIIVFYIEGAEGVLSNITPEKDVRGGDRLHEAFILDCFSYVS